MAVIGETMSRPTANILEIERRTAIGETVREIADALGISPATAGKWAKAYRAKVGRPLAVRGASKPQLRKLERLIEQGIPAAEIARQCRMKIDLVRKHRRLIMDANPSRVMLCRCGQLLAHPFGCDPNASKVSSSVIAEIQAMTRTGASSSTIAKSVGVHPETVLRHKRSVIDAMRRQGVNCRCGRPFGHAGFCHVHKMTVYPKSRRAQQMIHRHLIAGGSVAEVAPKLGFPASAGRKQLAIIRNTPDDLVKRMAAISASSRRSSDSSQSIARRGDETFAMVARLVPTTLPPDLRDDVVSAIYVDALAGTVTRSGIKAAIKTYVNGAFQTWANRFGDRSLDEALGSDTDLTLGDLVEDETGMSLVDDIVIGGAW